MIALLGGLTLASALLLLERAACLAGWRRCRFHSVNWCDPCPVARRRR